MTLKEVRRIPFKGFWPCAYRRGGVSLLSPDCQEKAQKKTGAPTGSLGPSLSTEMPRETVREGSRVAAEATFLVPGATKLGFFDRFVDL